MRYAFAAALLATGAALPAAGDFAGVRTGPSTSSTTTFGTVSIDGVNIFYREAGPKQAPTTPLLHGYPSSTPGTLLSTNRWTKPRP